jgi:hypothetical protein
MHREILEFQAGLLSEWRRNHTVRRNMREQYMEVMLEERK